MERELSWVKSHSGSTAKVCCCFLIRGCRKIQRDIEGDCNTRLSTGGRGVLQAQRVHERAADVPSARQVQDQRENLLETVDLPLHKVTNACTAALRSGKRSWSIWTSTRSFLDTSSGRCSPLAISAP